MTNEQINIAFSNLATPLIADACVRLEIELRTAPTGIHPVIAGNHIAGRALPVQHFGSVDVFLEVMRNAEPGDILVIDNQKRMDEGAIGDLTALEARASGIAAIVIWGCNRDTEELRKIGFPVFSYGYYPVGPLRTDKRTEGALVVAHFGLVDVTSCDVVCADADGVLFVPDERIEEVLQVAEQINNTERAQAKKVANGVTLKEQLKFEEYLKKREKDEGYSFREHLREIGGAIEE